MNVKSILESTNSLRMKIVLSLIGLTIFSVALSGFYSRLVLSERFQNVVVVSSSIGFARDVVGYYRTHGSSFEQAHNEEPWETHLAMLNQTRLRTTGGLEDIRDNTQSFVVADLNGMVWIPGGRFVIGDILPESDLQSAFPLVDNGVRIGYLLADGKLLMSGFETQYLTDLINSLWLSFLIVALVAVPLGIVLSKRLTNPINNLNGAIQALRPKTIFQSVPITSNDEIGSLSQSFNQMSEELAAYIEVIHQQQEKIIASEAMRQQAFVNISHELRTPLYGLVSQAQAMLDGVRALDRTEMKSLSDELDHLSELVDDLYNLALADAQSLSCDIEPTDYSLIVRTAIEARSEIFSSKGFTLDLSIPDKLIIDGDPTRLRQIVDNLLSNCIRYSNPGGELQVQLVSSGKYSELVVSDNGPGVPSESLDALFDRFYRIESSRNRATGGTGLGLSLVKTCTEMHKGNAEAFHSEQGGLGICIRIPMRSVLSSDTN